MFHPPLCNNVENCHYPTEKRQMNECQTFPRILHLLQMWHPFCRGFRIGFSSANFFFCKVKNTIPSDIGGALIYFAKFDLSIKSTILSIILANVTFKGRPERCSSFVDIQPCSNSSTQSYLVVKKAHMYHKLYPIRLWSLPVLNFINRRVYSSLQYNVFHLKKKSVSWTTMMKKSR